MRHIFLSPHPITSSETCSEKGSKAQRVAFSYTVAKPWLASLDSSNFHSLSTPCVELVVSPVDNAGASATQLTCLQLPIPDVLARSGNYGGGGTLNRAIRAFLVPKPTLTSWPSATHPDRIVDIADLGYETRYFGSLFASYE
jgi:hypothetical protein